ncbi:PRF1 [Mytilus edulis]|uniref:PRF1 n=1 Tax=Mytilus edulis TaxID=6550 RepID=A0A8S3TCS4_MYTED|nr:PRF1 [Mytilus edulis]
MHQHSPFLNRLRDGVDITKLDLLPIDASGNDGFRYPVIDFTCNENKVKKVNGKASKYVEDLTSQTAGYKINIIPEWGLKFSRVAKMYIERLLPKTLNDKSIEQYTTFINTFGTHYFNQGRFGGIFTTTLATDTSYFEKKTDKKVTVEAKSLFKKILKMDAKSSVKTKTIDTKFTNSTRNHVRYYGGKTNLLTAGEFHLGYLQCLTTLGYMEEVSLKYIN